MHNDVAQVWRTTGCCDVIGSRKILLRKKQPFKDPEVFTWFPVEYIRATLHGWIALEAKSLQQHAVEKWRLSKFLLCGGVGHRISRILSAKIPWLSRSLQSSDNDLTETSTERRQHLKCASVPEKRIPQPQLWTLPCTHPCASLKGGWLYGYRISSLFCRPARRTRVCNISLCRRECACTTNVEGCEVPKDNLFAYLIFYYCFPLQCGLLADSCLLRCHFCSSRVSFFCAVVKVKSCRAWNRRVFNQLRCVLCHTEKKLFVNKASIYGECI